VSRRSRFRRRLRRALDRQRGKREIVMMLRVPDNFVRDVRRELAARRKKNPDTYLTFDMFVRHLLLKSLAKDAT
jgi:hypothetical protein